MPLGQRSVPRAALPGHVRGGAGLRPGVVQAMEGSPGFPPEPMLLITDSESPPQQGPLSCEMLGSYAPRVVEVGCGDGGLAAYLRKQIGSNELGMLEFIATDATPLDRHHDVCSLAVAVGMPTFHSVSANDLHKYLKSESVEIILSANPFGYGLSFEGNQGGFYNPANYDWRFISSAMQVLQPGGILMMLVQSNLVYDYLNHPGLERQPLSLEDLLRHNVEALGEDVVITGKTNEFLYNMEGKARLGQLKVGNQFGPRGYTHLIAISQEIFDCPSGRFVFVPEFQLVHQPPVIFKAFDDLTANKLNIRGFNVQLVLRKTRWRGTHAPLSPIYAGNPNNPGRFPTYNELTSYLVANWMRREERRELALLRHNFRSQNPDTFRSFME
jgi:SAM-dependent methyltransferase